MLHSSQRRRVYDNQLSPQGPETPYERGDRKGVNAQQAERIENILGLLDVAARVEDMNVPTFRLHQLSGDLKGYWAVTVRANWRIIFRFDDGNAFDVDLIDYH